MTRKIGWYDGLTALLGGAAAALAHPPFGMLLGLAGYALILVRLERAADAGGRTAFRLGWLAGLGYFAISTWWIAEPFLVDPRVHGWMAPFAVVLMAGGLALFWGGAALAYRLLAPRGGLRVLVFAGVLSAFEWLRGHLLTGFPWNLPGESWQAGSAPSQAAAVVGAYGLTWITLAVSAAPALAVLPGRRMGRALSLAATGLGLTLLYAGGAGRLAAAGPAGGADPGAPMVRIVQANIDQKEKWKPENLEQIFGAYVELTRRPALSPPDIVVWPEGALPAVIDDLLASDYAARLQGALAPGQTLLMGVNRVEVPPDGKPRYFNALLAFRRDREALRTIGVYDKHRLVPFGEYIPLGELAGRIGLRSLVHMPDDFTAGPPPRPLIAGDLPPVQPLICYEALFPGLAMGRDRPAWILNVSNDAWFGLGSGPLQHLNLASYRAIEQGLPMVRATPTGVSAVIDAYGRIVPHTRLGLGQLGIADARLPRALPPTPYSRFGDAPFGAFLVLSTLAWAISRRRAERSRGAL